MAQNVNSAKVENSYLITVRILWLSGILKKPLHYLIYHPKVMI